MFKPLMTIMAAAFLAAPTAVKSASTKVKVDGVEYSVTITNGAEAIASLTGFRLWADRVGDWRKAVTAIERVSGCHASHVRVDRARNGGVAVGVWALLDCSNTTAEKPANE